MKLVFLTKRTKLKNTFQGALQELISTISTLHFIIYFMGLEFCNFKFIFRHLYLNKKWVDLDHFMPILENWLHQNIHILLIWWFIDLQMIPMRPLYWASQNFVVPGDKEGEKGVLSSQNLLQNLIFGQNWSFSPFISKFSPNIPQRT